MNNLECISHSSTVTPERHDETIGETIGDYIESTRWDAETVKTKGIGIRILVQEDEEYEA